MIFDKIRARAIAEWEAWEHSDKPRILIGTATCGQIAGALKILEAINKTLAANHLEAVITQVGCIGMCYLEPIINIIKPGRPHVYYGHLTPELASEIIEDYLVRDNPRPDLALGTVGGGGIEGIPMLFDLPMLKPQVRVILRNCGLINPERINDYIACGGYEALSRVLSGMTPEQVIDEIKRSGLRGRGGAGFPTAQKWNFCRQSLGTQKYMICNADEGDPGAFMDRSTMEGDPHTVIEGIMIAAYAIGASEGYIYCRAEYPLAIKRLHTAIKQAEELGILGENILGSTFSFRLHIKEGAGAFVCGEETALMASIEGKAGRPRPRPPFPAQSGLWGQPTNINNVKTLATIPVIINKGAEWYAGIGAGKSKGTTVFALTGKIAHSGLVEIPIGTLLREIIFDIGGGIPGGKLLKAVQTGGPSGGCLPASFLNSPVDYDSLAAAGSIMGSGGMVVMDEDTCMVDMAKFFLNFTQIESCGKCIPCRWGTKQMLNILEDIANGRGKPGDIDLLIELSEAIKVGSRCGLGQTAPNPVLTTIRYFREEYEQHIKNHHCPAAVCKGLVKAPCSHTCPAGVNVPRYIRLIADGDYDQALAVIREKIPFPSVCGYVCIHPCESKCRRGQLDEPIAIRALKRFIVDNARPFKETTVAASSGKKVAVVGSGPAGLTAAYYLAKLGGHAVTVFEALPEAGGMMRVGIPRYRLPAKLLDAEIDIIGQVGVKIKTNTRVESVEWLRQRGFDAIFLAIGAHGGADMRVSGEDTPGVIDCVELLREVSLGRKVALGGRVAIIGGGNAAIDASRTALRLGSKKVTIFYRRTLAEMPADKDEINEALKEGVEIRYLTNPSRIEKSNAHLRMTCLLMELGDIDSSGRRRPIPVNGSEFAADFDTIISAIGQVPEIPAPMNKEISNKNTIIANPDTLATSLEGVFAGGDAVSGPASVIEAIAAGRRASVAIDKYLSGKGLIQERLAPPEEITGKFEMEEQEEGYRPKMPMKAKGKRLGNFDIVEIGYTRRAAEKEASRCLRCDLEEQEIVAEAIEEPSIRGG
ncbi:MAG: NADH-ubiquinone oxidoreductase-F iron-sulfur binding region domain-containing protein [Dehalococcoidales bacterium]|nr:NADH-ubiquinone oxidoreductase-F iron-sulfur binding region domain-containing protein [Dehalococcoidales bacterium]